MNEEKEGHTWNRETLDRESLYLNYEGQWELMALEQVEVILPCPDMIECRGSRRLWYDLSCGGLIPVFRPEKGMKTVPKKAPACVVLIRKEDGSLYGMAADEVTGGTRLIRFTNEEFTQLTTYMSSQYGIDLSKKKILAECRMNGELKTR
ncbi:MAG: hypothetical protein ACLRXA_24370 [Clostridium sp.]